MYPIQFMLHNTIGLGGRHGLVDLPFVFVNSSFINVACIMSNTVRVPVTVD